MSEEQQDKFTDLCEDPGKLRDAIKLFNRVFKFGDDPTLSYFFDKDALLELMEDPECLGIKVFPALEDNRDEKDISITMVLKPFPQSSSSKEFAANEEDDPAFLGAPAICCPTPGKPFEKKRKKRLKYWIHRLLDLI